MNLCVGLFGTCGNSRWRARFIEEYTKLGIPFFNPQVDDWKPECAFEEAEHLANDVIVLFPVTGETYGLGSLAETGFSVLQAIRLDDRREFVILVDKDLDPSQSDPNLRKESLRARALVLQHLKKLRLPNVYLVETLDEMLEVSLQLFELTKIRLPLLRFNPHNVDHP